jgi:hypothetical protein
VVSELGPVMSHSENSCFKWSLQGLFTRICSWGLLSRYDHKVSIHCMNQRCDLQF